MKTLIALFIFFIGATTVASAQQGTDNTTTPDKKIEGTGVLQPFTFDTPPRTLDPLYIVTREGVADEITKKEFDDLTKNASRIKSIEILKDQTAAILYGEKAKNGVIVMELKTDPTFHPKAVPEN